MKRSVFAAFLPFVLAFSSAVGRLSAQDTVFHYSFHVDDAFPDVIDFGPFGNDGTAQPGAGLSFDVPAEHVPDDAGDAALDSGTSIGGVVTNAASLLTNQAIADFGGFTMEAWFKWNGGGNVNSIIDYAGTEKIVLTAATGELAMLIDGTGRIPIAVVEPNRWYYVAVVFDTEGAPVDLQGFATGTVRIYLDSLAPLVERPGAIKNLFGDSLVRPIGVGQHPLGFAADFFDGLIFEPRVSLGVVEPEDLLLRARLTDPPSTLLAYEFASDTALPVIADTSAAGNDATAAGGAAILLETPRLPRGVGGDASLDTTAGGAVTDAPGLLSTDTIGGASGFTFETWLRWSGTGSGSILDSAGTEKLTISATGQIQMIVSDSESIAVGQATAGTWHWVAVVFDTKARFEETNRVLRGDVTVYFDSVDDPVVTTDVELAQTNGGAGIGIGQSPDGGSAFPGAIFAPIVTLGPLRRSTELSYRIPFQPPVPVFRYSEIDDALFPFVPDVSEAGNDALAGPGARVTEDIPEEGVPDDAGELALDSSDSTVGDPGIVTESVSLLTNPLVAQHGGFTYECWFQWLGGGQVNAIIDYAGTEKIVIDERDALNMGMVEMRIDPSGDFLIGIAQPFEWHYVAVVFETDGRPVAPDGSVSGMLTVYFDSTEPAAVYENVTKSTYGDSLVRGIGVGRHPIEGVSVDYFNGYVFEPRVTLGPLSSDELLYGGSIEPPVGNLFVRGDANGDGNLNLTDGINILNYLFVGSVTIDCLDAADSDNSNSLNLTDGIYVLSYLFSGGDAPPPPFEECGTDPELDEDDLTCEVSQPSCL